MNSVLKNPRLVVPVVAAGLLVLAVSLAAFQPWRLFTTTTVIEAEPATSAAAAAAAAPAAARPSVTGSSLPPLPPAAGPVTLATGRFVSQEHRTAGNVRLIRLPDGSVVVRLEELTTSDGPALHVWLTDQPVRVGSDGWHLFDDGRYIDLGDLKGNRGDQNYPVPSGTDLAGLTSVTVWCARFHVSFGAAALTAKV